jgi:hypothetical protein
MLKHHKKQRRLDKFTFDMCDQVESAIRVWAKSPNSFSVSVGTFARWLQVGVDTAPSFHEHQVVIDSESKLPVYLNLYAGISWCRHDDTTTKPRTWPT